MQFVKCMIMLLYTYATIFLTPLICNLDLGQSIQPSYVALFIEKMIDNYNRNGSNVYSCLLNASKAFDKIYYGKLFNVLLKKGVPFYIIRILFDAYTIQQARVFNF